MEAPGKPSIDETGSEKPWPSVSVGSGGRHQHCSRTQLLGMEMGL